jgi:hypothetical protein
MSVALIALTPHVCSNAPAFLPNLGNKVLKHDKKTAQSNNGLIKPERARTDVGEVSIYGSAMKQKGKMGWVNVRRKR